MSFKDDIKRGKVGENVCVEYILTHNKDVKKEWIFDVSDNPLFQLFDIDLLFAKNELAYKKLYYLLYKTQEIPNLYSLFVENVFYNDDIIPIEIKLDTRTNGLHPTNNIAFEINTKNSPGTYSTRARYVFYVCVRQEKDKSDKHQISAIYMINIKHLRVFHRNTLKNNMNVKYSIFDNNIIILFNVDELLKNNIIKSVPIDFIKDRVFVL